MKYDNISENEKDYVIEIFTSFIIKDMNESDYSNELKIRKEIQNYFKEYEYIIIHSKDDKYRYKLYNNGIIEKYNSMDKEVE
jgi:hypothetical protein